MGKWIEIVDELPRKDGESYMEYENRKAGREGRAVLIGAAIGVAGLILYCIFSSY